MKTKSESSTAIVKHNTRNHSNDQLNKPIKNRRDFDNTLKQLFQAYEEGQFNDLEGAARNLYNFIVANEKSHPDAYWVAMPMLYELHDIFDFAKGLNEDIAKRAQQVYSELRELQVRWSKSGTISREARELARQKVLYCACGANELKRAGDIREATKMFECLLEFTGKISTTDFPCFGTQANLSYQLGSLYRIREKHELAEATFSDTLELLRKKSTEAPDNVNKQLALIRKKAMVVGIGYGWVNYTRGFLRRAENALVTARSLLATSQHPIIPWYIELLYGTILRCHAGTKKEEIARAIASLKTACQAFELRGHMRYAARAHWELALAFNLAADCEAAQEHLDFVAQHTKQTGHPKWQTNVRVLQSRQYQKKGLYDDALREAELALDIANRYEATLPIVDAHLAIGEVKLAVAKEGIEKSDNVVTAISNFKRARKVVSESNLRNQQSSLPSNPKIVAVCELRIAQCLALIGEESEANTHLSHWRILEPNVEHEWVRELARTVTEEVKQLSLNFTISADKKDEWDYSESVANLRRWLLQQALRRTGKNYSKAAELIGVKRATLYQWQEDNNKSKRARTKS
jgi:tetratricopeptide (TPR) repeat protein